jgi:hypothetical protein
MAKQLGLFDGERRRDEGIALVSLNSGEWMVRARAVAMEYLAHHAGEIITADPIRNVVQAALGQPHHQNAWGALTRSLIGRRFLRPTGRLAKSPRASNHAHANPEYEVLAG